MSQTITTFQTMLATALASLSEKDRARKVTAIQGARTADLVRIAVEAADADAQVAHAPIRASLAGEIPPEFRPGRMKAALAYTARMAEERGEAPPKGAVARKVTKSASGNGKQAQAQAPKPVAPPVQA